MECNGFKIGVTICYDSNKSIFSAAYGDVDLLINLTGGHVDNKKWIIYQKARALENWCNYLCTMAYFSDTARNRSYVYGFDGYGKNYHTKSKIIKMIKVMTCQMVFIFMKLIKNMKSF